MAANMIHYAISRRILGQIIVNDADRLLLGASIVPDVSSHDDGSLLVICMKKIIQINLNNQKYFSIMRLFHY